MTGSGRRSARSRIKSSIDGNEDDDDSPSRSMSNKTVSPVCNSGAGVPVEIHQEEEGVYVPEMIFEHLLTSSNYDYSMKKTIGGRNGYGAKLTTNILKLCYKICV